VAKVKTVLTIDFVSTQPQLHKNCYSVRTSAILFRNQRIMILRTSLIYRLCIEGKNQKSKSQG